MVKIAANAAASVHAPGSSRVACTSAYIAGADVLRLPVRLTRDSRAVVAEEDDITLATGQPGKISELTLAELRQRNFAASFNDASGNPFKAPAMKVETFGFLLDVIPSQPWLLIELKAETDAMRRSTLVQNVIGAARNRGRSERMIVYSSDAETLRAVRSASPRSKIASYAPDLPPLEQLEAAVNVDSDAVVLQLASVVDKSVAHPKLTTFGSPVAARGAPDSCASERS